MAENLEKATNAHTLPKKLESAGWGAFFIWIGIALLANLSWGVGLIGIGLIVLAGQATQTFFSLPMSWFWLIIGVIIVFCGVSDVLRIEIGGILWPIVSIMVGLAVLITGLRPHPRH